MTRHPARSSGPRAIAVLAIGMLITGGAVVVSAEVPTTPPPRIAVLARSDNPVDALSATAVAAQLNGVVLVTPRDALDPSARQGLIDFAPDLVILAGGPGALSEDVKMAVEAIPLPTRRVAGTNRHETSAALAALLGELGAGYLDVRDAGALHEPRAQTVIGGGMSPALDADRTRGFSSVVRVGTGVYCLVLGADTGIDITAAVVHTGVEWSGSAGTDLLAMWVSTAESCLDGEIEVRTFTTAGDATDDADVTVVVP